MKIYAEKGFSWTEAERLETGRLLLKGGYVVMLGKEKVGNTTRQYIEFYHRVAFGNIKAAPDAANIEDGGAEENNSMIKIPRGEWNVNERDPVSGR